MNINFSRKLLFWEKFNGKAFLNLGELLNLHEMLE